MLLYFSARFIRGWGITPLPSSVNPHLNVQILIIPTKCYKNIVLTPSADPLWFHHKSTTAMHMQIMIIFNNYSQSQSPSCNSGIRKMKLPLHFFQTYFRIAYSHKMLSWARLHGNKSISWPYCLYVILKYVFFKLMYSECIVACPEALVRKSVVSGIKMRNDDLRCRCRANPLTSQSLAGRLITYIIIMQ